MAWSNKTVACVFLAGTIGGFSLAKVFNNGQGDAEAYLQKNFSYYTDVKVDMVPRTIMGSEGGLGRAFTATRDDGEKVKGYISMESKDNAVLMFSFDAKGNYK